jgi:hypothetical protein
MVAFGLNVWSKSRWRGYDGKYVHFLEKLAHKLSIECPEQWYLIELHQLSANEAQEIKIKFGSLFHCLWNVYPEYEWLPWSFTSVPMGFWNYIENQKCFIEWLLVKLQKRNTLEDLYSLTSKDIIEHGGWSIMELYGSSHIKMLESLYPNFDWQPWLFKFVPQSFWLNEHNHRCYMDWLAEHLKFNRLVIMLLNDRNGLYNNN